MKLEEREDPGDVGVVRVAAEAKLAEKIRNRLGSELSAFLQLGAERWRQVLVHAEAARLVGVGWQRHVGGTGRMVGCCSFEASDQLRSRTWIDELCKLGIRKTGKLGTDGVEAGNGRLVLMLMLVVACMLECSIG